VLIEHACDERKVGFVPGEHVARGQELFVGLGEALPLGHSDEVAEHAGVHIQSDRPCPKCMGTGIGQR
jgi:hypothetical protein